MKKIAFSLFVAFIISLATVAASALVLTDDWKNAETTDLEAAVREIQKEISQRLTKDGTATVFSGHGDTSLGIIPFHQQITRVTVHGKAEVDIHPDDVGGYYAINDELYDVSVGTVRESGDFRVNIESAEDWTIIFEPLNATGSAEISGSGRYVSNLFRCLTDDLYHISFDASDLSSYAGIEVILKYGTTNVSGFPGWHEQNAAKYMLFDQPVFEADFSFPYSEISYWYVDVPDGVKWSIERL